MYCAVDLGFKALHLRCGENLAIELFGVLNVGLVSLHTDPCVQMEKPICNLRIVLLNAPCIYKILLHIQMLLYPVFCLVKSSWCLCSLAQLTMCTLMFTEAQADVFSCFVLLAQLN